MPEGQRVLVAADETDELLLACKGAALLLELLGTQQLANRTQEDLAPRAALAILNVALERMKHLVRALRDGEAGSLIAEFNSALMNAHLREDVAVLLPAVKVRSENGQPVTSKRVRR